MKLRFCHVNFNVLDLKKSMDFYEEALGLKEERRITSEDFIIVYLGDGQTDFLLELTWLKERTEPYDLGEQEFHLAFYAKNFEGARAFHREKGWVCFENEEMGIYFIQDPDGYWLEVLPEKES
ncbi:MAG: lactoylglutathione lyase [Fretibacterium sp.]|nr:lactoylglutathione lyase [Fretibacterium sp.]